MRWFRQRTTNVALHCPYVIGAQWPDPLFAENERRQYPDAGQLTSGQIPGADRRDGNWLGLLRQYGRSVTVDLGRTCHIQDVQLSMLEDVVAGIFLPDSLIAYVSADAQSWYQVGSSEISPTPANGTARVLTLNIQCNALARYVRLQCTAKVYLFLGGLAVRGKPQPEGVDTRSISSESALSTTMGFDYLMDSHLAPPGFRATPTYLRANDLANGGVRNMQLVYSGSKDSVGTWTADDFWPMVVGLDTKGTVKGRLFDATLFLPHGKMTTTAAAWQDWLADLFSPGVQLEALDAAVERANVALSQPDFQAAVVLTLPGTNANPADFGAVAEGGPSLVLDPAKIGYQHAAEQKTAALSWFLRNLLNRWRSSRLPHLRLTGIYWQPESVNVKDPFDTELIRQMANAVHAENLCFYWIPYYGAPGVTVAQSLGFDAVFLQPNAAFHPEVNTEERLEAAAAMAKAYGMGLELELHWDVLSIDPTRAEAARQRYGAYLRGGHHHQFAGDVCKAYYLGSKTLLHCARSADALTQGIYQSTVSFITDRAT